MVYGTNVSKGEGDGERAHDEVNQTHECGVPPRGQARWHAQPLNTECSQANKRRQGWHISRGIVAEAFGLEIAV